MLIAFFLAIIAANAIFITLAVKSFPGEQEKKSYLQGLSYNDRIAARDAQNALGWSVEISNAGLADGRAAIDLLFKSGTASPLSTLAISGTLTRPAADGSDHEIIFVEVEPGLYRASLEGVAPGAWRLAATATSQRGETFALEKRLTLQ